MRTLKVICPVPERIQRGGKVGEKTENCGVQSKQNWSHVSAKTTSVSLYPILFLLLLGAKHEI